MVKQRKASTLLDRSPCTEPSPLRWTASLWPAHPVVFALWVVQALLKMHFCFCHRERTRPGVHGTFSSHERMCGLNHRYLVGLLHYKNVKWVLIVRAQTLPRLNNCRQLCPPEPCSHTWLCCPPYSCLEGNCVTLVLHQTYTGTSAYS